VGVRRDLEVSSLGLPSEARRKTRERWWTRRAPLGTSSSSGFGSFVTPGGPSPLRTQATVVRSQKSDEQKGAVEGDHRSDKELGNENAVGALDKNGLPKNKKAIAEDSIGARADETQG
jgi:hypothetical protein